MPYQQLTLTATREAADALTLALFELEALSVTLEDGLDEPIHEPALGETPLWTCTKLKGLFDVSVDLHAVLRQLEKHFELPLEGVIQAIPDKDWERESLDQFKPMHFGKRLCISPSWESVDDDSKVVVTLDPGLAFGTGSHATTRLMLQHLDGHDLDGKIVVDYGCGSGILGIAAAKLGAEKVIAVDYDPQALTATLRNAKDNAVEHKISVHLPDETPAVHADLLLANIVINPLIALRPTFFDLLKTNGMLVVSGVLHTQCEELIQSFLTLFEHRDTVQDEDWCRLTFIKP